MQWDTYKRLLAILDRQAGRKPPVVIHVWGRSNFNVAASMGRILRDRGIDATVGSTEVEACNGKPEAECFAAKRQGGSLDAQDNTATDALCDTACVLMLAGGVHRSLPAGTRMILSGMTIRNRLAPNVSDERRAGLDRVLRSTVPPLPARDGRRSRADRHHRQEFGNRHAEPKSPPADWTRLRIVTPSSQSI